MKLDNPVYIFKIMTINADQDSEHLSISECHSSKLNSVLLVLETFLKEQLLYVIM